ncbi:MAG TPA: adenosylcobinamide-phosphate synthase CbiB [Candidatus Dormibacteraeota bacterium]|nr:adenosylcobinamide-phosphate synthase CbiB [Candidatus Dormibacteraeota bacterium]
MPVRPALSCGAGVLGLALAVDAALGEPPEPLHPVVWMGRVVGLLVPEDGPAPPRGRLLRGAAVTAAGGALAAGAGALVSRAAARLGPAGAAAVEAVALSSLLALRTLLDAGRRVAAALEADDRDAARTHLRWLVGRDLDGLAPPLLASAAVESLAENLSDSVVAPLLHARLGGLPAAALYRFVNTADASVGYRDRFRLGGRAAARLDDVLGLMPARLSALLVAAAVPAGGGSARAALRCWRRDHGATASPNAGHPMAAMAGGLGVRLEKRGHHVLNGGGRPCRPADVHRAVATVRAAAVAAVGVCSLLPAPGGRP